MDVERIGCAWFQDVSDIQGLQEDSVKPLMSIVMYYARPSRTTINSGMNPEGPQTRAKCYYNGDWSQYQTCSINNRNSTWGGSDVALYDWDMEPETLITIDFSAFGNASSQAPFQVGIYPGISNSTTIADTKPIYLGPGSHYYAVSVISLREQISKQGYAVIGIPKVSHIKYYR